MEKRLYLILSVFTLLAACDSSTGAAVTDSSSNSSANGASVVWDSVANDSLLSTANGMITSRHTYWSGDVLAKSDNSQPFWIVGDTLQYGYEKKRYIRASGQAGSVFGKWRYANIIDPDTSIKKFTAEQLERYDSLTALGRYYVKLGGGIKELEITNTRFVERRYYGTKPAYMRLASEFDNYNCSWSAVSYSDPTVSYYASCVDIILGLNTKPRYSYINDTAVRVIAPGVTETFTLSYTSRKNEFYLSGYFVPKIYSSSNPDHKPITDPGDGDFNRPYRKNTWLDSLGFFLF